MAKLNEEGTITVYGHAYQTPDLPQKITLTAHAVTPDPDFKYDQGYRNRGVWVNMREDKYNEPGYTFTSGILSPDEAEAYGTALIYYARQAREAEARDGE